MSATKTHKSIHNISLWCCKKSFCLKWWSGKHIGNRISYSSSNIFQVAAKWSSTENSGMIFPFSLVLMEKVVCEHSSLRILTSLYNKYQHFYYIYIKFGFEEDQK